MLLSIIYSSHNLRRSKHKSKGIRVTFGDCLHIWKYNGETYSGCDERHPGAPGKWCYTNNFFKTWRYCSA